MCKKKSHNTRGCRKRNYSAKSAVNDDDNSHYFAMKVNDCNNSVDALSQCLLVDCGATSHIITDKNKFKHFDDSFDSANHYIELADGSRTNNVVFGKGDASITIKDQYGEPHDVILKDALCIYSISKTFYLSELLLIMVCVCVCVIYS